MATAQRRYNLLADDSQQVVRQQALQRMAAQHASAELPRMENRTGLPDGLKSGIESLSGISMDHVRVHYNSAQPAQLNALAYAQGSDIHLAPGQEKHLPHEAWHVVQQAQGRVRPTMQMKDGVPINDDAGLEREADVMGEKAAQHKLTADMVTKGLPHATFPGDMPRQYAQGGIVQRHVLIGSMIKGQDNPAQIDPGSWANFPVANVFDSGTHRGNMENARSGSRFSWDGTRDVLATNIASIRNATGYGGDNPNFPVVVNANTYKTPGFDSIPQDYQVGAMHAFGSGWSLSYNLTPFAQTANYSNDYAAVLDAWEHFPLVPFANQHQQQPALGRDRASHVLRHLSKRYWLANKNFVIPHRGLRNLALDYIHDSDLVEAIQRQVGETDGEGRFVSIIHLDDDMQVEDGGVISNILSTAEPRTQDRTGKRLGSPKKGVVFSAPGYIYKQENNLLEYTASILSHIAGRVVKGSYPSEPGLTVTYDYGIHDDVWRNFLLKSPWGVENANLQALPSYGNKQNKARVESKEGRAFSYQYAEYLTQYRDAPQSTKVANKVPIRSANYFSVSMSGVARDEIIKEQLDVSNLNILQVQELILTYIRRNKYHPAGGSSKEAKSFIANVLPHVAAFVHSVLAEQLDATAKQQKILATLESISNEGYKEMMKGGPTYSISSSEDLNWPQEIIARINPAIPLDRAENLQSCATAIAYWIEEAIKFLPDLEEEISDLVSDCVAEYAKAHSPGNEAIPEILDVLVAEIVYGESYAEAWDDLRTNPKYQNYVIALGK